MPAAFTDDDKENRLLEEPGQRALFDGSAQGAA
jgi:hypothetical protein